MRRHGQEASDPGNLVLRAADSFNALSGTCQRCGCTERTACRTIDGPCSWVDRDERLCSSCVTPAELEALLDEQLEQLADDDRRRGSSRLLDAYGRPIGGGQ